MSRETREPDSNPLHEGRTQAPDLDAAKRAVADFLRALGYDPASPEFNQTPANVVEAYTAELLAGERADIEAIVRGGAVPASTKDLVILRGLQVTTICPHHLLPAEGTAVVAYVPGNCLLGLGTVSHLVEACSRRLTLQEQIGQHVVAALMQHGRARGALCALSLEHACLRLRGARQASAVVDTIHIDGVLRESPYLEQLNLLGIRANG